MFTLGPLNSLGGPACVCMYACIYVRMHMHACLHVCMHAYMYASHSLSPFTVVYRHDATKGQHLNVTSNETITLQCNFDSMESGRIQWFRNGNPVNFMVSILLYIYLLQIFMVLNFHLILMINVIVVTCA